MTFPLVASTIAMSMPALVSAAWRRKLSTVISKWMIAGDSSKRTGTGAEFEITHSLVSVDTYGSAW